MNSYNYRAWRIGTGVVSILLLLAAVNLYVFSSTTLGSPTGTTTFRWSNNEVMTPQLDGDTGEIWLESNRPFTAIKVTNDGVKYLQSLAVWDKKTASTVYRNNTDLIGDDPLVREPYLLGKGGYTLIEGDNILARYSNSSNIMGLISLSPVDSRVWFPLVLIVLIVGLFTAVTQIYFGELDRKYGELRRRRIANDKMWSQTKHRRSRRSTFS